MQILPSQQSLTPTEVSQLMQRVLYEVKKVVVGQDVFLERVMKIGRAHV